jgi:hypothetical protein
MELQVIAPRRLAQKTSPQGEQIDTIKQKRHIFSKDFACPGLSDSNGMH